jgi:hypothetical protein
MKIPLKELLGQIPPAMSSAEVFETRPHLLSKTPVHLFSLKFIDALPR